MEGLCGLTLLRKESTEKSHKCVEIVDEWEAKGVKQSHSQWCPVFKQKEMVTYKGEKKIPQKEISFLIVKVQKLPRNVIVVGSCFEILGSHLNISVSNYCSWPCFEHRLVLVNLQRCLPVWIMLSMRDLSQRLWWHFIITYWWKQNKVVLKN